MTQEIRTAPDASWCYKLLQLGRELGRNPHPERICEAMLTEVVDAFHASTGSLALWDPRIEKLVIVAGIELPVEAIGKRIALGEGVIGWVAQARRDLLLNGDLSSDPRFALPDRTAVADSPVDRSRSRSSLCWPLSFDDQLLGVISLNRRDGMPSFTDADRDEGQVLVDVLSPVLENARLHVVTEGRVRQLQKLNARLEETQNQLVQSEKMASIGQLAAGVAHEINNPVGYVSSNLVSLKGYLEDFLQLLGLYERIEATLPDDAPLLLELRAAKERIDLDYLRSDSLDLMSECDEGITRVKKIVQDLKDFSRVDSGDWEWTDLHGGIETTLNVVWNELKYKATIERAFGELPEVYCIPSQINQVLMNLMVNAAHAIPEHGTIEIATRHDPDRNEVRIEVADSGCGIPGEVMKRIFDPFFTTKPVGKGTGLGLSLSYGIVQKHGGSLTVTSVVGQGSRFRITLPVNGPVRSTPDADSGSSA